MEIDKIIILDSSPLITSSRYTYPNDIFTGYWNTLLELAKEEKIQSIDKVKGEINKGKDDDYLVQWIRQEEDIFDTFFKSTSSENVLKKYAEVIRKVKQEKSDCKPKALEDFSKIERADAWLIAYALLDKDNSIIVTDELRAPQRKADIKIPDICDMFGIDTWSIIETLRHFGITI